MSEVQSTESAQQAPNPTVPLVSNPTSPLADTTKPEIAATPEKNDEFQKRFAELTRRQQKLDGERSRHAEERKAYEAERNEYRTYVEALKEAKKGNPLAILKSGEVTLEQLIDAKLREGQVPRPEDKIKTLEEKLEALANERNKEREDAKLQKQEETYNNELSAFKQTLSGHLEKDSGKYELIIATDSSDAVFDAIREVVSGNPDDYPDRASVEALIPTVSEEIENQLSERIKLLSKAEGKVKNLLGWQTTAADQQGKSTVTGSLAQAITKPEVTLTNKNSGATTTQSVPTKESKEERLKRIAAKLQADLDQAKKASAKT